MTVSTPVTVLLPPGTPHPADWTEAPLNSTEFLIDQPPGKYLYLRIRMRGTGNITPVIRRIRIDFPRSTSLDELPAIYGDESEAADFTDRFLSMFDASMEDLDRAIERFPALLDPGGVPEEVLPWLGSFLGIVFEPAMATEQRRELLHKAPWLFRRTGTAGGLIAAVELAFGVTPAITEHSLDLSWGAVGRSTRLGSVRLFGRNRARFRVGRSALGVAPLRSYGDPVQDPFLLSAHRFTVSVPPQSSGGRAVDPVRLDMFITSHKPAHAAHTVRVGGGGFVLGYRSVVGIDTVLASPAVPVVGGRGRPGTIRLNRAGVLRPGPSGRSSGLVVGHRSAVGIHTALE